MTPTLTELAQAWMTDLATMAGSKTINELTEARMSMERDGIAFLTAAAQAEKEAEELRTTLEATQDEVRNMDGLWQEARAELSALRAEVDEALMLTECCSSLKDMAALIVEGAAFRAEVAEVLRPFAEAATACKFHEDGRLLVEVTGLSVGNLRAAAALLAKPDGGEK